MDARSKANFINSVAGGQKKTCPKCNILNDADSKFCISCGTSLEQPTEVSAVPFAPVKRESVVKNEDIPREPAVKVKPVEVYVEEPESVFAQGLPEWDIEPPQVMVRRRRK